MKVKLVGSSVEGATEKQYLTSLLIDETVCIDAGSIGFTPDLEEQAAVQHLFLSHTHIDHLASLPIFLENVYMPIPEAVVVHASSHGIDCLRHDIFNTRVWPDFLTLGGSAAPFCKLSEIRSEEPIECNGLRITPVDVEHGIPAFGFIVESDDSAIVVASDTAPTERIWSLANDLDNLAGVFLDASFPNDMLWLAQASHHMTPQLIGAELEKLRADVPVYAVHIKARYREQVTAELAELGQPRLRVASPGEEYVL